MLGTDSSGNMTLGCYMGKMGALDPSVTCMDNISWVASSLSKNINKCYNKLETCSDIYNDIKCESNCNNISSDDKLFHTSFNTMLHESDNAILGICEECNIHHEGPTSVHGNINSALSHLDQQMENIEEAVGKLKSNVSK